MASALRSGTSVRSPEITQGVLSRCAGTHFEVHDLELFGQDGTHRLDFVRDANERLVQAESRLDAHHQHVQGVGQGLLNFLLPQPDPSSQEAGREHPEHAATRDGPQEHVPTLERREHGDDDDRPHDQRQDTQRVVDCDRILASVAGADQLLAGLEQVLSPA